MAPVGGADITGMSSWPAGREDEDEDEKSGVFPQGYWRVGGKPGVGRLLPQQVMKV